MEHQRQEPLPDALRNYKLWSRLTSVGAWRLTQMRNEAPSLAYRPKLSILLPVYNPKRAWLEQALDSVMAQTYPYWELCVCDDGSSEPHVKEILGLYERLDGRVKVRRLEENSGIVGATNAAFSLATGEFVGLMDHDDTLAPEALFEVARFLQESPEADLIYSDEDKIDESGETLQPHFKPDWSPDLALSVNYLVHLSVYRHSLLAEVGGWREGFDGAQDFDLMLRFTEKTDKIHHIPKVLYHWRTVTGSTAAGAESKPYTHETARQAVRDALGRRNIQGRVLDSGIPNSFRVEREIKGQPKVSVLIPLREGADHDRCVASLELRTSYPNYEILLTKTGKDSFQALSNRTSIMQISGVSTPLELLNAACRQATGEYVLILDPDLEASADGWLEALLQHAQREEIGAVGGRLLYPEGETLQAGLFLNPEAREDLPQTFYRPCNRQSPGFRIFLDLARNCSAVSRECIMLRKDVFESVGEFDTEHLEHEFGDVDLCLRLRERGYRIVYTPYAEFTRHNPEPGSGLNPEQARYVRERWGKGFEDDPYYNPNLLWTARDLHSALELMGLGSRAQTATKRSRVMES